MRNSFWVLPAGRRATRPSVVPLPSLRFDNTQRTTGRHNAAQYTRGTSRIHSGDNSWRGLATLYYCCAVKVYVGRDAMAPHSSGVGHTCVRCLLSSGSEGLAATNSSSTAGHQNSTRYRNPRRRACKERDRSDRSIPLCPRALTVSFAHTRRKKDTCVDKQDNRQTGTREASKRRRLRTHPHGTTHTHTQREREPHHLCQGQQGEFLSSEGKLGQRTLLALSHAEVNSVVDSVNHSVAVGRGPNSGTHRARDGETGREGGREKGDQGEISRRQKSHGDSNTEARQQTKLKSTSFHPAKAGDRSRVGGGGRGTQPQDDRSSNHITSLLKRTSRRAAHEPHHITHRHPSLPRLPRSAVLDEPESFRQACLELLHVHPSCQRLSKGAERKKRGRTQTKQHSSWPVSTAA